MKSASKQVSSDLGAGGPGPLLTQQGNIKDRRKSSSSNSSSETVKASKQLKKPVKVADQESNENASKQSTATVNPFVFIAGGNSSSTLFGKKDSTNTQDSGLLFKSSSTGLFGQTAQQQGLANRLKPSAFGSQTTGSQPTFSAIAQNASGSLFGANVTNTFGKPASTETAPKPANLFESLVKQQQVSGVSRF